MSATPRSTPTQNVAADAETPRTAPASRPEHGATGNPPAAAPDPGDQILRRLYQDCQRQKDSLAASLGISTWRLMHLSNTLHAAIGAFFSAAEKVPAAYEKLYPHLDMLIKLHRQIERYAQLQVKAAPKNQSGRGEAHSPPLDPFQLLVQSDRLKALDGEQSDQTFHPPQPTLIPPQPPEFVPQFHRSPISEV